MYSIVLIIAGLVSLFTAIKFLRDPEFAKKYIETSPKAWLWRKFFGVENAMKITKSFFAPIGITLGTFLIVAGVVFLLFPDFNFSKNNEGITSESTIKKTEEGKMIENAIEKSALKSTKKEIDNNLIVKNTDALGVGYENTSPQNDTLASTKTNPTIQKASAVMEYVNVCDVEGNCKISLTSVGVPSGLSHNDCGSDKQCFLNASTMCSPAKVRDLDSSIIPNLGVVVLVEENTLWEKIKVIGKYYTPVAEGWSYGGVDGNCVLLSRVVDVEFEYSDEVRQKLVENGNSSEEIVQSSAVVETRLRDKFNGKTAICVLLTTKLTDILRRDLLGDETYDITKEGLCTGDLLAAFKS